MKNIVLLLLTLMVIASTNPFLTADGSDNNDVLIGVYFYPWYSITQGKHWRGVDAVIDKPFWGFYDSYNESIIKMQLVLIKHAGIDFIVFSWWGPNSFEDMSIKAIVRHLAEYGLKFAVMIEPYLGSKIKPDEPNNPYNKTFWKNVLSYLSENYILPYKDNYLHLYGKPLVLAFNPIGMKYNPSNDFPEYTIRITGNDIDNAHYQDWDYWPDYIDPNNVNLRIRKDGYVSIMPRFDNTHLTEKETKICIDQNYTQLLYQKEWEWILKHRDNIKIIMITSWNEYHERTMIEPHYDATANVDPFYIYDLTVMYIKVLKNNYQTNNYCTQIDDKTSNYTLLTYVIIGVITGLIIYNVTSRIFRLLMSRVSIS